MHRVLMIAHTFPPASGAGIPRTLAFARYLPQHGWQPFVLTIGQPIDTRLDAAPLATLPPEVVVVRTAWFHPRLAMRGLRRRMKRRPDSSPDGQQGWAGMVQTETPSRLRVLFRALLFVPDQAIGWLPFAVWRGLRVIRGEDVDVIYSTSGPPTSHLIALLLKRLTSRPWIADFRDPWTADPMASRRQLYGLAWRLKLDRYLERQVLTRADYVVTVSERQREVVGRAIARRQPERFAVITNGFDPADFEGIVRLPPPVFTLTYTGTIYLGVRGPEALLRAIAALQGSDAIDPRDFGVRIVGVTSKEVAAAVAEYGVGGVVTVLGSVGHRAALQEQVNASALLLLQGRAEGEQGALTGKLFEYLAARRPILGLLSPHSPVADILRRSRSGAVVDQADQAAIQAAILALYAEFKASGDVRWRGREEVIEAFTRPKLTGQLADLLDRLVPTGGCPSTAIAASAEPSCTSS